MQVAARVMSSQNTSQKVKEPGDDLSRMLALPPSSTFSGDICQAGGVELKWGQVLLEMGMGKRAGTGHCWLVLESFQSSGLLTPSQAGLSMFCDSPCRLRGAPSGMGEGSTGLKEP